MSALANNLHGRHILLGVTGGIAAYKSADLVRRLREAGAEVRVVMTAAATEFVTPLTFQALSGHRVATTLLDAEAEAAMGHIELARWADAVVVAPATANFTARLAHGLADDLLATLCLASDKPLLLAPAMNRVMWQAAATQENRATLMYRGMRFAGPDDGPQACGETGSGRMREVPALVNDIAALFGKPRLAGVDVLVTAGPTREAIDPVRFIGNRSSGKMGFAVAAAARDAGASVTLVSGPVALPTPAGITRVDVSSTAQMLAAVEAHIEDADIFIACAAVADFRPVADSTEKLKKTGNTLTLELTETADILATVSHAHPDIFSVGFAAETHDLAGHAQDKLARKSLDMIAANQVAASGPGIESDDNALTVFWHGGEQQLPLASKTALAGSLVNLIADHFLEKHRTENSG